MDKQISSLQFDDDGFLTSPEQWSEVIASDIAHGSGIDRLENKHLDVLRYLREHYLAKGTLPAERNLCRDLDMEHECIDRLFGGDLMRAWRIAGLPNPGEEAKTYMRRRPNRMRRRPNHRGN